MQNSDWIPLNLNYTNEWNLGPANVKFCSLKPDIRSHRVSKAKFKEPLSPRLHKGPRFKQSHCTAVSSNPAATKFCYYQAKSTREVKVTVLPLGLYSRLPPPPRCREHLLFLLTWHPFASCSSKSKWHLSENQFFSWEHDAGCGGGGSWITTLHLPWFRSDDFHHHILLTIGIQLETDPHDLICS